MLHTFALNVDWSIALLTFVVINPKYDDRPQWTIGNPITIQFQERIGVKQRRGQRQRKRHVKIEVRVT